MLQTARRNSFTREAGGIMRFDWQFEEPMALRALVSVASLTDPGSAIRSCYISDLSLSFRNALENVTLAFVDATALLDQK